jgi:hypothetical protein
LAQSGAPSPVWIYITPVKSFGIPLVQEAFGNSQEGLPSTLHQSCYWLREANATPMHLPASSHAARRLIAGAWASRRCSSSRGAAYSSPTRMNVLWISAPRTQLHGSCGTLRTCRLTGCVLYSLPKQLFMMGLINISHSANEDSVSTVSSSSP